MNKPMTLSDKIRQALFEAPDFIRCEDVAEITGIDLLTVRPIVYAMFHADQIKRKQIGITHNGRPQYGYKLFKLPVKKPGRGVRFGYAGL